MKPWWKSRTIWVNVAAAALAALATVLEAVREAFGPVLYIIVATLLPAVNVILRVVTVAPIETRRREQGDGTH